MASINLTYHKGKIITVVKTPFDSDLISWLKSEKFYWNPSDLAWYSSNPFLYHKFELPDFVTWEIGLRYRLQWLKSKMTRENYSTRTIRTYSSQIRLFENFYPDTGTPIYSESKISQYIQDRIENKNWKSSTIQSALLSLKFYCTHWERVPFPQSIRYPKKESHLPEILSKSEVLRLCHSPKFSKHRMLLLLAYSSGLRVSEVVSLKLSDIDIERKMIRICQGKGKKDRFVPLSSLVETFYRENKGEWEKENSDWLFPGQVSPHHLSIRTAQKIFENAKILSGISKSVSFHSLRHAYATHLLERGVGIRSIQILLGHKNVRTTERYTHVAKTNLMQIKSPLDQ